MPTHRVPLIPGDGSGPGHTEAATRVPGAAASAVGCGFGVIYDLRPNRIDPAAGGTAEYTDAITEKLRG
ncbi:MULTISPECIES: hypothetical protein [Protofrankia]|uniref:Uncharacterized protein n=1 Tax=Protofrankia coriariae TaxID=1562887 RepID=A0ABR5F7J7_9ACTN|nr:MULTISPECIES: hypothetical protein [Protofrankia]KLL12700.1 hypothetical protein FrCorBMG51_03300 [Protofrankia coriariae]ONH36143.1 hypothetical protein BL254_08255 [Protofrankia sp. BMG5.30]